MAGPAEKLLKLGHKVTRFTEYHFRIDGSFDFWLPSGKWHDLVTLERGQKPLDQLHFFVHERLASKAPSSKKHFIENLVEIGWSREEAISEWNATKSKAKVLAGRLNHEAE